MRISPRSGKSPEELVERPKEKVRVGDGVGRGGGESMLRILWVSREAQGRNKGRV